MLLHSVMVGATLTQMRAGASWTGYLMFTKVADDDKLGILKMNPSVVYPLVI